MDYLLNIAFSFYLFQKNESIYFIQMTLRMQLDTNHEQSVNTISVIQILFLLKSRAAALKTKDFGAVFKLDN